MYDFSACTSPCWTKIPLSVEAVQQFGLLRWQVRHRSDFWSEGGLRKIDEFCQCPSLCRIEISSSVEVIEPVGFEKCLSLTEVIFHQRVIWGWFMHFDDVNRFVELKFVHQLKWLSNLVSSIVHPSQKLLECYWIRNLFRSKLVISKKLTSLEICIEIEIQRQMSISVRISIQVDGFGWQFPRQTTRSDPTSHAAIQSLIQAELPI
jgi:hypothetical protein